MHLTTPTTDSGCMQPTVVLGKDDVGLVFVYTLGERSGRSLVLPFGVASASSNLEPKPAGGDWKVTASSGQTFFLSLGTRLVGQGPWGLLGDSGSV